MPINYVAPGPVASEFLYSDAFIAGIRGPIGSGKSTACVMKLVRNFQKQKPGPDGIRRRRTAIIRNSYPELKTTTIKTWHQWIPETQGKWTAQGPPTHRLTTATDDWEVIFVALDRPEDTRKLLSMELSDAWINEAREVPKAVADALTGRVGRYPAVKDGGCTDPQVLMDTNPPDTDHWWPRWADFPDPETAARNEQLQEILWREGALRPDQPLYQFFTQPSGLSEQAENIKNLPPGYYEKAMAGKTDEWIKVYVRGDYGFVQDGKAVYPEYHDNLHCKMFELNRALPVWVGIDFGLTPAATFAQRTLMGGWRVHYELVSEDMGARRFGEQLNIVLRDKYRGFQIAGITGDPAGEARAQSDETTPFQMLRAVGVNATPAPTNDFTKRREAVAFCLSRLIDGEPGLVIHPDCQRLRKAMSGGYKFKRIQVGEERYADAPVKDMHSHVAESLQYLLCGAGEARAVVKRDPSTFGHRRQTFAITDWDIFGSRSQNGR